tara:strand:- start:3292 stop:4182 length:891 start_codon:yes stop_codon:yes gene_type:complete
MSEDNNNNDFFDISFKDIFVSANKHIKKIFSLTLVGALLSVIYSLTIPEKYVSQAISIQAEISNPSQVDSAGGLLKIFGPTSKSSTDKTLTILKSRSFFRNFYDDDQFLFELMAVESFDTKNKSYKVDNSLYNQNDNSWISKPSFEESFKVFNEEFNVSSDLVTGEIYTSTKHVNPVVALQWNTAILAKINQITKEKQIIKSSSAIDYYKMQLNNDNSLAVKSVLMSSMSKELQTIATSNVNDEYSLEVIDPPFLPERSSEPNNAVISILGTILSFVLFFTYFVFSDLYKSFNRKN